MSNRSEPLDAPASYVPGRYWRALHERGDLSAVGQSGLPPGINSWLYRTVARSVERFLQNNDVRLRPGQVAFEVGVGIGYWLPYWRALGASRVDGCDLVPEVVERLSAIAPPDGGRFRVADVASADWVDDERYDFVAVLNVLLHIMDEDQFNAAVTNVARLVAPGGWLFLAEPILFNDHWERPFSQAASSRARSAARYLRPTEAAGLRLVAMEAGTALGSNPIESRSRLGYAAFRAWWMFMAGTTRLANWSSTPIGRIVSLLDRPLLRFGAAPSTKFALFQRPIADAAGPPPQR